MSGVFAALGSAGRVVVPFSAGYVVSYLFRTVNAVIAPDLARELGLSAADLGLLTSIYFVTFAGAQLPLGLLLDRYGPRRVQVALLAVAAAGAACFATAGSLPALLAGRALIGLGVAGALMAALKANALFLARDRLTLANAGVVASGGLGAYAAAGPADALLHAGLDWRALFFLLAAVTAAVAAVIHLAAPDEAAKNPARAGADGPLVALAATLRGLRPIYGDAFFWRLAPASACAIGSAWSIQGLWAGRWLAEVEGLSRAEVVGHLSSMGIALAAGALLLGLANDRLKRAGVPPLARVAGAFLCFAAVQAAIIARVPLPGVVLWSVFAAFGGATVLGYAALADRFPKELAGRANAALNLMHVGSACLLQWGMGLVVELWPATAEGGHPPAAYAAAFTLVLVLQLAALLWLLVPTSHRRRAARRGGEEPMTTGAIASPVLP